MCALSQGQVLMSRGMWLCALIQPVAYRRDRNVRAAYEDRFFSERGGPDRRPPFNRPDDDYGRGFDYDEPRYCPNGGPRGYQGDDMRTYHANVGHFERRSGPPRREEPYYRGPRDEGHGGGRPMDFRNSRAGPPPGFRTQGMYHHPRSLPPGGPEGSDDTLLQAIMSLDRGDHRDNFRRKQPFPPQRERSPFRKDVPPSPHSRSGSSLSSRSYSPERSKAFSYQNQQRKNVAHPVLLPAVDAVFAGRLPQSGHLAGTLSLEYDEPLPPSKELEKDRPTVNPSRDGSPQSTSSTSKAAAEKVSHVLEPIAAEEEVPEAHIPSQEVPSEVQTECKDPEKPEEPPEVLDEAERIKNDFQERRALAISAKAREIEEVYRQDCETFGMVVKMLVAKEPSLEQLLQTPMKENLSEIRERCLDDLKHFITELDEAVLLPETSH